MRTNRISHVFILLASLLQTAALVLGGCTGIKTETVSGPFETTTRTITVENTITITETTSATVTEIPTTAATAISSEQAVAISAEYLTPEIIGQSGVSTELLYRGNLPGYPPSHQPVWQVVYYGFSASRDELRAAGWTPDSHTIFPDFPDTGYHYAYFNIDADTGTLLMKAVWPLQESLAPDATAVVFESGERPIDVQSVRYIDNSILTTLPDGRTATLVVPSGPSLKISVINKGAQPIILLLLELGITIPDKSLPFIFGSDISGTNPLKPGATTGSARFLMGSSFEYGKYYPVFISGTFQDGQTFFETQYVDVSR